MHRFTDAEAEALDRFARALRGFRSRSGQSRAELAQACGLSASYIKDLEAGIRRPRFETLMRLACGLAPASGRSTSDGGVRFRGDFEYRARWSQDPDGAAEAAYHELVASAEGAIAPTRDDVRTRAQLA